MVPADNTCHKHIPVTKITMNIFEFVAILVTCSPRSSKYMIFMMSPGSVLRILMLVAWVSFPRRTGRTSGQYP